MISAVIGAAYGDEGKGLVTDAVCARHAAIAVNVRASSSAQAGHTVVAPNGRLRHAFGHVGAGTFAGARTWLGPEFLIHPILFANESDALLGLWGSIDVSASPDCAVVTPFDMDLNRRTELARGAKRHGSCGVGIHEAVLRHAALPTQLTFGQLVTQTYGQLRATLHRIRDGYAATRAEALALPSAPPVGDDVIERYLADVAVVRERIRVEPMVRFGSFALYAPTPVVFEGAQGLRLDQNSPDFPHVTHARTGLGPVVDLVPLGSIVHAYYVTRCYTTRHGAGPLAGEWGAHSFVDDANVPNEWQGSLRYGPLDLDRLTVDITRDVDAARKYVDVRAHLVMTCCDQVKEARLLDGRAMAPAAAAEVLADRIGADEVWLSSGRTRDHLTPLRVGVAR